MTNGEMNMTVESTIFWLVRGRGIEAKGLPVPQNQLQSESVLATDRGEQELEAMKVKSHRRCPQSCCERAMLGDEPIHAVISTIGGLPGLLRADYLGNKNLRRAARLKPGCKFIWFLRLAVGIIAVALPLKLSKLWDQFEMKEKAEAFNSSGLTYHHPTRQAKSGTSNRQWGFDRRSNNRGQSIALTLPINCAATRF